MSFMQNGSNFESVPFSLESAFDDDISSVSSGEFSDIEFDGTEIIKKFSDLTKKIDDKVESIQFDIDVAKNTKMLVQKKYDLKTMTNSTLMVTPGQSKNVPVVTPVTELYGSQNALNDTVMGKVNSTSSTPLFRHSGIDNITSERIVDEITDSSMLRRNDDSDRTDQLLTETLHKQNETISMLNEKANYWQEYAQQNERHFQQQLEFNRLSTATTDGVTTIQSSHTTLSMTQNQSSMSPILSNSSSTGARVQQAILNTSTSTAGVLSLRQSEDHSAYSQNSLRDEYKMLNESVRSRTSSHEAFVEELAARRQDIASLQQLRDTMTEQLVVLTRDRDRLLNHVSVLQQENRDQLLALEHKDNEHAIHMSETLRDLQEQLASAQSRHITELTGKQDEHMQKLKQLEMEYGDELSSLRQQLQHSQNELQLTQQTLQKNESDALRMRDEWSRAIANSTATTEEKVRIAENQFRESEQLLKKERSGLSQQLLALQGKYNALALQDSQKDQELLTLRQSLDDLNSQFKTNEAKWFRDVSASLRQTVDESRLISSADQYSFEVSQLRDSMDRVMESEASLRRRFLEVESEKREELRAIREARDKEVRELNLHYVAEIEHMKKEHSSVLAQFALRVKEKSSTDDTFSELIIRANAAEAEASKVRLECLALGGQNDSLKRQVKDLGEAVAVRERQLTTLQTDFESNRDNYERLQSVHTTDLQTVTDLKVKCKQQKSDIKARIKRDNETLRMLRDKLHDGLLSAGVDLASTLLNDSFESLRSSHEGVVHHDTKNSNVWTEINTMIDELIAHQREAVLRGAERENDMAVRQQLRDLESRLREKERETAKMQRDHEHVVRMQNSSLQSADEHLHQVTQDLTDRVNKAEQALHTQQRSDLKHLESMREMLSFSSIQTGSSSLSITSAGDKILSDKCATMWHEVITAMQNTVSSQQEKLSVKHDEINSLMREIESQHKRLIAFEQRHESDQNIISELKTKVSHAKESNKAQLTQSVEHLRSLNALLQSVISTSSSHSRSRHNREKDELRQSIESLSSRHLDTTYSQLWAEASSLVNRVSDEHQQLLRKIKESEEFVKSLKRDLSDTQSKSAAQINERDALFSELHRKFEQQEVHHKQQSNALRDDLLKAQTELKHSTSDRMKMQSTFDKQLTSLTAECETLSKEANLLSDSLQERTEQLDQVRHRSEERITSLERELNSLKSHKSQKDRERIQLCCDVLHIVKNMPVSSSSLIRAVPSTPYGSFVMPDTIDDVLAQLRDELTMKSTEVSEYIHHTVSHNEEFTDDLKRFMHTLLHTFDEIQTKGLETPYSQQPSALMSTVHLNKYPHLNNTVDKELNNMLLSLENKVRDTIYRVENVESYLLSKKTELKTLQSQLVIAENKTREGEAEHLVRQKEVTEMKRVLDEYSGAVLNFKEQSNAFHIHETELRKNLDACRAVMLKEEEKYQILEAERLQLEKALTEANQLLDSSAVESTTSNNKICQLTSSLHRAHEESKRLEHALATSINEQDDLKVKLSQSDRELQKTRSAVEQLQSSQAEYQSKIAALQKGNDDHDSTQHALESDKQQLEFKVHLLTQSLSTMQQTIQDGDIGRQELLEKLKEASQVELNVKSELRNVTRDRDILTTQLAQAHADNESQRDSLNALKSSNRELESKIASVSAENVEFGSLFADAQQTIAMLNGKIDVLNTEIVTYNAAAHDTHELLNIRHRLEVMEEQLNSCKLSLADAELAKVQLESTVSALLLKEKSLTSQLSETNALVEEFSQQYTALQEDLRIVSDERDDIKNVVCELTKQIDHYKSTVSESESAASTLSADVKDIKQRLVSKDQEIVSLQNTFHDEKQSFLDAFNEEIDEYEAALVRATARQSELETQIEVVTSKLNTTRKSLEEARESADKVTEQFRAQSVELSQQTQQLQDMATDNLALRASIETLTSKLDVTNKSLHSLQSVNLEAKNKISTLSGEISTKDVLLAESKQENQFLSEQMSSLKDELVTSQQVVKDLRVNNRAVEQQLDVIKQKDWSHSRAIEDFADERTQLTSQLSAVSVELNTLRVSLHEGQVQLRDKERMIADYRNKESFLQASALSLEKERDSLQAQLHSTMNELHDTQASFSESKSSVASLNKQLETLHHESLFQSSRIIALLSEKDDYLARLDEQKRVCSVLNKELLDIKAAIVHSKDSESRFEAENTELQTQLEHVKTDLKKSTNLISTLQVNNKKLESQVVALNHREAEHIAAYAALNVVNDDLNSALCESKQEVHTVKNELSSMKYQLQGAESDRKDITLHESQLEATLEELQKERNYLNTQHDALLREQKKNKLQLRDQNLALSHLEEEFRLAKSQLEETEAQLESVTRDKMELIGQLEDSNVEFNQFSFNLQGIQREHDAQIVEQKSTISVLTRSLAMLKEENSELVVQLRTLSSEQQRREEALLRKHNKEVAALTEKEKSSKQSLSMLAQELRSLEDEYSAARNKTEVDLRNLTSQLDTKNRELTHKSTQYSEAVVEIERLQGVIRTSSAGLNVHEDANRELSAEVKKSKMEIGALEHKIESLESEKLTIRQQLNEITRSRDDFKGELSSLLTELQTARDAHDDEVQTLQKALAELTLNAKEKSARYELVLSTLNESHASEIAEHNVTVEELENIVTTLQAEREAMRSEWVATATLVEEQHQTHILQLNASILQLSEEIESLTSVNESQTKVIDEKCAECESLAISFQSSQVQLASVQKEKSELENQVVELQVSADESSSKIVDLKDQLHTVNDQFSKLSDTIARLQDQHSSDVAQLTREYEQASQCLQTCLSSALSTLSSITSDSNIAQSLTVLASSDPTTTETLQILNTVLTDITTSHIQTCTKMSELAKEKAELRLQLEDVSEQLQQEQTQLHLMQENVALVSATQSSSSDLVKSLQSDLAEKTQLVETYTERIRSLETSSVQNETILAQLRQHNAELQSNCESLVSELGYSLQRIATMEKTDFDRHTELQSQHETEMFNAAKQIEKLVGELSSIRSQFHEKDSEQLVSALKENEEVQREVIALTEQVQLQSVTLATCQQDLSEALKENSLLYSENRHLADLSASLERVQSDMTMQCDQLKDEMQTVYSQIELFREVVNKSSHNSPVALRSSHSKNNRMNKVQSAIDLFNEVARRHVKLLYDNNILASQTIAQHNQQTIEEKEGVIAELQNTVDDQSRLIKSSLREIMSVVSSSFTDTDEFASMDVDKCVSVESMLSVLISTIQSIAKVNTSASQQQSILSSQVVVANSRLSDANTRLAQLEASEAAHLQCEQELRQELTRKLVERTSLMESMSALKKENLTLSEQLRQCNEEIHSLEQRDSEWNARCEEDSEQYRENIEGLESQIEDLQREMASLQKERDALLNEKESILQTIQQFDMHVIHPIEEHSTSVSVTSFANNSSRSTATSGHTKSDVSPQKDSYNNGNTTVDTEIMSGFDKLLRERRRLKRTCSSQQLCILSLRLLLKEAENMSLPSPVSVTVERKNSEKKTSMSQQQQR